MGSRILADLLVIVHFAFVLFVAAGGLLVLRWPRLAFVHLPAAIWGAWIEFTGGICPLTPLEKSLRVRAGEAAYAGDFVDHYILPILYPSGMTRTAQLVLGVAVVAVNVVLYTIVAIGRRRRA
ncbi:MAG: DUF2784 domain-containing protein [Gemmatimonadales bacterium]